MSAARDLLGACSLYVLCRQEADGGRDHPLRLDRVSLDRGLVDPSGAVKVSAVLVRIRNGNTSGLKGVERGVLEWRIDSGPGYRIYLGFDGADVVILLAGGTKRRQQNDIQRAIARWVEYKKRKSARWL